MGFARLDAFDVGVVGGGVGGNVTVAVGGGDGVNGGVVGGGVVAGCG